MNLGLMDEEIGEGLLAAYRTIKRTLGRIRLFSGRKIDGIDTDSPQLGQVAKSLKYKDKNDLLEEIKNTRTNIRKAYNTIFD